jgi:hypothetical protein
MRLGKAQIWANPRILGLIKLNRDSDKMHSGIAHDSNIGKYVGNLVLNILLYDQ